MKSEEWRVKSEKMGNEEFRMENGEVFSVGVVKGVPMCNF